ncbi:MAG TPA: nucleotidyltransferase family protein [Bacteroidia bacterium]|nr:nucleotidyltransferase family protein [Bacteroidia bacterium]
MLSSAVILAGGLGTRLQSKLSDLPKAMAPVCGRPFLDYQLLFLRKHGIKKVHLSIGHLAEKIMLHYGPSFEDIALDYVTEKSAMGTGGGIGLAMERSSETELFVLNGDSYFDMDLHDFHAKHASSGAQHSLALREVENASRYGTIQLDSENRVIAFREKSGKSQKGLINAGIYILNRKLYLDQTPAHTQFSVEKDYFEESLDEVCIKGFVYKGYFMDIGIPEDFEQAQHDFKRFAH